jgi:hypothetical protein
VSTDQADYVPGSVVTISGDDSNGAGYQAGETVDVAVTAASGWTSSCSATADESGAWSCQFTLSSDPAVAAGAYSYTATGESSGVSETGAFTDTPPPATDTSLSIAPGTSTGTSGQVYYGDSLTFSGSVTKHSDGSLVDSGTITVKESNERKANLCATADFAAKKLDIFSQSITDGSYTSGLFSPVLSTFPTNSIANGHYAIANAFAAPQPVQAYASSVGTYAFQTSFDDSGNSHFAASDSPCVQEDVVKAPTTTTSKPADGTGALLTQVGVSVPFYVEWGVTSIYGVTGNNAGGTATLNQSASGLGCPAGSVNAKSFSVAETTGSGFTYAANSSTNNTNRFNCTATAPGTYTVYVSFTDNPETAATNPDGNYQDSQSSASTVNVVPVTVQACMAAPAIAAAYLKTKNIKINSPKYDNIVQLIANEMAAAQQARFPTYTYTTGSKSNPTPGALLRPCDNGYASSVQAKTQYYIDTLR